MLFNEPKLLKSELLCDNRSRVCGFSALQRAEIAEIQGGNAVVMAQAICFSALQRAEIAEIVMTRYQLQLRARFSALQRAEIAEMPQPLLKPRTLGVGFQCSSTSRNC